MMKILNVRTALFGITTAALILTVGNEAGATLLPTNVLFQSGGRTPLASPGWGVFPITWLTDGSNNGPYVVKPSSISFDLGSSSGREYHLNGIGIAEEPLGAGTRNNWSNAVIEVSNVADFSTLVTPAFTVPLAIATDTSLQTVEFPMVTGRYVRVSNNAFWVNPSGDPFTRVQTMALFGEAVPEPASVTLLLLGGLVGWRFVKRWNA